MIGILGSLATLLESMGWSLEKQHVRVMGQSVEQRCRQRRVAEYLDPAREIQVRGDYMEYGQVAGSALVLGACVQLLGCLS